MEPVEISYLATPVGGCAICFDRPEGTERRAVLICSPWGWDEVSSYRTRKLWAEHLAAAGHPVLRFDLPAVGDSAGTPSTEGLLAAWVAATTSAAEWLAATTGQDAVAAIGLGLGGLLVRAAAAAGAPIAEAALWAAPASGKALAREIRAFSRLQDRSTEEAAEDDLPDGWMDAGGFFLSADTLAELKALAPTEIGALKRALLLGKDGVDPDASVVTGLEEAGVEVERADGLGWGVMVSDARLSLLPDTTVAAVDAWLGRGPEPGRADGSKPVEIDDALEVTVEGATVVERPTFFDLPFGRAVGILGAPADGPTSDVCAVFLNSGNVRHTGPNRLWVEGARHWAAHGVQTLRLDLEAIGEADGERPDYVETVAALYVDSFVDQAAMVLDQLEERGIGRRFVLLGLCAGAYWSFQGAVRDERVVAAVLLNSGALSWDGRILADRAEREAGAAARKVLSLDWWRRALSGGVDLRWLLHHGRSMLASLPRALGKLLRRGGGGGSEAAGPDRQSSFEEGFDRLQARGTDLFLAFSGGEVMHADLVAGGVLPRLGDWPTIELVDLPGSDHTLRSPAAQRAALEVFDRALTRTVEKVGSGEAERSAGA
jgi:alpha-beta hydrolase superfamily lysophospholipase